MNWNNSTFQVSHAPVFKNYLWYFTTLMFTKVSRKVTNMIELFFIDFLYKKIEPVPHPDLIWAYRFPKVLVWTFYQHLKLSNGGVEAEFLKIFYIRCRRGSVFLFLERILFQDYLQTISFSVYIKCARKKYLNCFRAPIAFKTRTKTRLELALTMLKH